MTAKITKRNRAFWNAANAAGGPHEREAMAAFECIAAVAPRADRKPRSKDEAKAQIKIVVYLRRHLPEGAVVWHTPNMRRSENHGHHLRSMGMMAGLPDLFVLTEGRLFGLEVKSATGALSSAQTYTHARLASQACACAVVRDAEGAQVFLESMGVVFR